MSLQKLLERLSSGSRNGCEKHGPRNCYRNILSYHFGLFAAVVFGISGLLPWNAFITASKFFIYKLKQGSNTEFFTTNFYSILSISSNIPLIIGHVINTLFIYKLDKRIRCYLCFSVISVGFFVLIGSSFIDTKNHATLYLIITMSVSAILNISTAICVGAFFAYFGLFPSRYLTMYLMGQALAGLMINFIDIMLLLVDKDNLKNYGLKYFILVVIFMAVNYIIFGFFTASPHYKYYILQATAEDPQIQEEGFNVSIRRYCKIMKNTLVPLLVIYINFAQTLFMFPEFTLKLKSVNQSNKTWSETLFPSVIVFAAFNLGDMIGKIFPHFHRLRGYSYLLLILTISRFGFLVGFMLCPNEKNLWGIKQILNHDIFGGLMVWLFGFTNGYYSTLAFEATPKLVDKSENEMSSTLNTLALGLGLATGSVMSFLLN